eukprot:jgi/Mesen1/8668/ME000504S08105
MGEACSVTPIHASHGDYGSETWHTTNLDVAGTVGHRLLFWSDVGQRASPWHDILLDAEQQTIPIVCTLPKSGEERYQLAYEEPFTPLKPKDRSSYSLYPLKAPWNCGFLPQTCADCEEITEGTSTNTRGPIPVIDIGSASAYMGAVYSVKPLAALAAVGRQGQLLWKIVGIASTDPMAQILSCHADVEKHRPELFTRVLRWLTMNGTYAEGKGGMFWMNERPANVEVALTIVAHAHMAWKVLHDQKMLPGTSASAADARRTAGLPAYECRTTRRRLSESEAPPDLPELLEGVRDAYPLNLQRTRPGKRGSSLDLAPGASTPPWSVVSEWKKGAPIQVADTRRPTAVPPCTPKTDPSPRVKRDMTREGHGGGGASRDRGSAGGEPAGGGGSASSSPVRAWPPPAAFRGSVPAWDDRDSLAALFHLQQQQRAEAAERADLAQEWRDRGIEAGGGSGDGDKHLLQGEKQQQQQPKQLSGYGHGLRRARSGAELLSPLSPDAASPPPSFNPSSGPSPSVLDLRVLLASPQRPRPPNRTHERGPLGWVRGSEELLPNVPGSRQTSPSHTPLSSSGHGSPRQQGGVGGSSSQWGSPTVRSGGSSHQTSPSRQPCSAQSSPRPITCASLSQRHVMFAPDEPPAEAARWASGPPTAAAAALVSSSAAAVAAHSTWEALDALVMSSLDDCQYALDSPPRQQDASLLRPASERACEASGCRAGGGGGGASREPAPYVRQGMPFADFKSKKDLKKLPTFPNHQREEGLATSAATTTTTSSSSSIRRGASGEHYHQANGNSYTRESSHSSEIHPSKSTWGGARDVWGNSAGSPARRRPEAPHSHSLSPAKYNGGLSTGAVKNLQKSLSSSRIQAPPLPPAQMRVVEVEEEWEIKQEVRYSLRRRSSMPECDIQAEAAAALWQAQQNGPDVRDTQLNLEESDFFRSSRRGRTHSRRRSLPEGCAMQDILAAREVTCAMQDILLAGREAGEQLRTFDATGGLR